MTRGARAEAAAERKLSATTAGASLPRRRRNASDSFTCCPRALASLLPSFVAGSTWLCDIRPYHLAVEPEGVVDAKSGKANGRVDAAAREDLRYSPAAPETLTMLCFHHSQVSVPVAMLTARAGLVGWGGEGRGLLFFSPLDCQGSLKAPLPFWVGLGPFTGSPCMATPSQRRSIIGIAINTSNTTSRLCADCGDCKILADAREKAQDDLVIAEELLQADST